MKTYCCKCGKNVDATLTTADKIYPTWGFDRLKTIPFLQCPHCREYAVKTLGEKPTIPDEYIRKKRIEIHQILDPLWIKQGYPRGKIYSLMSKKIGHPFHSGEIKTHEEADECLLAAIQVEFDL